MRITYDLGSAKYWLELDTQWVSDYISLIFFLPQRPAHICAFLLCKGAIILSNYVARSGKHCALDAAMAISGGLDMRQQLNFKRSMRLWQPMLTIGLREDILVGKYAKHYKHRLTNEQFLGMLRATSISVRLRYVEKCRSISSRIHVNFSPLSCVINRRLT